MEQSRPFFFSKNAQQNITNLNKSQHPDMLHSANLVISGDL
jgi:hypothetical protein